MSERSQAFKKAVDEQRFELWEHGARSFEELYLTIGVDGMLNILKLATRATLANRELPRHMLRTALNIHLALSKNPALWLTGRIYFSMYKENGSQGIIGWLSCDQTEIVQGSYTRRYGIRQPDSSVASQH